MKKIFLVLLLCLAPEIMLQAQVHAWLNSNEGADDVNFSFLERDNKIYLSINFDSYFNSFPEQSQVLMRFFDDSVLQLDGVRIQKDQTREGGWLIKNDMFHSTAEYIIKKEEIESFKIGIKKIRVITVPNILEKSYKKDKLGKKLYKLYTESAF